MRVRKCFRELDQPVLVLKQLYQVHELLLVCAAGFGAVILSAVLFGMGLWGVIAMSVSTILVVSGLTRFFQMLRKGTPGHVQAKLHRWGILNLLPPGIRPRYLIPAPGLFSDQRKIRLMPIEGGSHGQCGIRSAYFGR